MRAVLLIDGREFAGVEADNEAYVMAEIMHYAMMYREEKWTKSFVVKLTKGK